MLGRAVSPQRKNPMPTTIRVILGSTREGRLCPAVAGWVAGLGREVTGLDCILVDLAERHLPTDDEPAIPASGQYVQPHTVAWSREVAGTDAFVLVSPQYNWGYPAPLKNALDHLAKEWAGKPVMIVTYGGSGGTKASLQLHQVANALKMRSTIVAPALPLPKGTIGSDAPLDPDTAFADHADRVREGFGELAAMLAQPAD